MEEEDENYDTNNNNNNNNKSNDNKTKYNLRKKPRKPLNNVNDCDNSDDSDYYASNEEINPEPKPKKKPKKKAKNQSKNKKQKNNIDLQELVLDLLKKNENEAYEVRPIYEALNIKEKYKYWYDNEWKPLRSSGILHPHHYSFKKYMWNGTKKAELKKNPNNNNNNNNKKKQSTNNNNNNNATTNPNQSKSKSKSTPKSKTNPKPKKNANDNDINMIESDPSLNESNKDNDNDIDMNEDDDDIQSSSNKSDTDPSLSETSVDKYNNRKKEIESLITNHEFEELLFDDPVVLVCIKEHQDRNHCIQFILERIYPNSFHYARELFKYCVNYAIYSNDNALLIQLKENYNEIKQFINLDEQITNNNNNNYQTNNNCKYLIYWQSADLRFEVFDRNSTWREKKCIEQTITQFLWNKVNLITKECLNEYNDLSYLNNNNYNNNKFEEIFQLFTNIKKKFYLLNVATNKVFIRQINTHECSRLISMINQEKNEKRRYHLTKLLYLLFLINPLLDYIDIKLFESYQNHMNLLLVLFILFLNNLNNKSFEKISKVTFTNQEYQHFLYFYNFLLNKNHYTHSLKKSMKKFLDKVQNPMQEKEDDDNNNNIIIIIIIII